MLTSEILVEVGRNLNRTSAEVSAQSVTLLNSWLRDWHTRWPYADYLETSATSAMTASVQQYTLGSDIDKLIDLYIPTLGKPQRLTEEQLRAIGPSAEYGSPVAYSMFGEFGINFYPIPTSAFGFSYSYYKGIVSINAVSALSAQTPFISSKYHDAGIWYVTGKLAQRMGDMDLVTLATAEYERIFKIASADMINRVAGLKRINFADEQFENVTAIRDKADEMFNS